MKPIYEIESDLLANVESQWNEHDINTDQCNLLTEFIHYVVVPKLTKFENNVKENIITSLLKGVIVKKELTDVERDVNYGINYCVEIIKNL